MLRAGLPYEPAVQQLFSHLSAQFLLRPSSLLAQSVSSSAAGPPITAADAQSPRIPASHASRGASPAASSSPAATSGRCFRFLYVRHHRPYSTGAFAAAAASFNTDGGDY